MILDTSFIVDIFRKDRKIETLVKTIYDEELVFVTSVSIMELFSGAIQGKKTEEEIKKIEDFEQTCILLPFDRASAEEAGRIHGNLKNRGQLIEVPDIMIGAIAKVRKDKVLTRNPEHFKRMGVDVVEY